MQPLDKYLIEQAIPRRQQIEINYIPNTKPFGVVYSLRYIVPIELFSKNGKKYLFAYHMSGGSLSGAGSGFRLYLQDNISNVRLTNVTNVRKKELMSFKNLVSI